MNPALVREAEQGRSIEDGDINGRLTVSPLHRSDRIYPTHRPVGPGQVEDVPTLSQEIGK
ncbi:MAG: hypothetical protein RL322_311 [Pseudomonadota bacterium]